MNIASRKLRILCLHGMAQNSILFEKKTAGFLQDLKDRAEFVYVRGPHRVLDPELVSLVERATVVGEQVSEEMRPFAWWFLPRSKPLTEEGFFYGFKESVEHIKQVLLEKGPFDGIIGFSQGACFTGCLAHMLDKRDFLIPADFPHPPLQFVVMVGGFILTVQPATESKLFSASATRKVETPSMHIIGELDTIILPERSDALADAFKNPFIFRHAGGHFVPKTTAARQSLNKFLATAIPEDRSQAHI
ncbi:serine hydrolase FSH [Zychaea mexicana]|uniref:serine hydrolase FSH n=1 Tax=Zychaea mexicana TaxID=64656 RepID=UPI0022FF0DC5|nr:serine hydrolase FSH [Zychaea mexicana]KAI9491929.1 serine hydrolase FSH [Zychaea mexicana]